MTDAGRAGQRRKEHLKKLEAADRDRRSTHAEVLEQLQLEISELRLENENLRLCMSDRGSPTAPGISSPSSYSPSPFPTYELYGSQTAGGDPSSQPPQSHSLAPSIHSDSISSLCVLSPRNIADVRRDLHERLAPILDLNILSDPQLHLRTLAALAPSLPAPLQPTFMQLQRPHHIYIDLIPSPSLRDRLIQVGFETANAFLTEVCTFVYEAEDHKQLIIWGDDHLSEFSWEFSEEVLKKWGGTILSDEWRTRANFWRRQRNAPLLH
jgi:Domain of unknown function (DUF3425)